MLGYVRELLARQNIEDFHPGTYSHVAYRSTRERPWTNRNPATRPMVTSTGPISSFFATRLDTIDPTIHTSHDATHSRAIIATNNACTKAQQDLLNAVKDAREADDSWTVIGTALGISRQAAQQRFGEQI